jgi:pimeloyl-ACP methyl ester carboxylesterase
MDVRGKNNVTVIGPEAGRVVMLAHGFGCDQNLWRLVAPVLAYSTLAGYAEDVLTICRELDLRDVVLIGHSVSAMIAVLAANEEPDRFAKLILLTPSPRYINDGDYYGGFSKADIEELLDSLESNYLGWSAAMAPVIMGNPDRPELGQELTNSFCRTDPKICPHVRPCHLHVRQPRRSGSRSGADAGHRVHQRRHRTARGRSLRAPPHPGQRSGHPGRHRSLPPAQRPRSDCDGDRGIRLVIETWR